MKESAGGFEDRCMISCGMLQPEIQHLIEEGFLNPLKVLFTPPGLHALPPMLEEHLMNRVNQARHLCPDSEIIVVYGRNCYTNPDEPDRGIDRVLREAGEGIVRVQSEYGYDMLASMEERQRISGGRQSRILWFTPGWLKNWRLVYQRYLGWDKADANANFPGYYEKIIVLDALGVEAEYSTRRAEEVLELFDWAGLEVEFHPITIDRFKELLLNTKHQKEETLQNE